MVRGRKRKNTLRQQILSEKQSYIKNRDETFRCPLLISLCVLTQCSAAGFSCAHAHTQLTVCVWCVFNVCSKQRFLSNQWEKNIESILPTLITSFSNIQYNWHILNYVSVSLVPFGTSILHSVSPVLLKGSSRQFFAEIHKPLDVYDAKVWSLVAKINFSNLLKK